MISDIERREAARRLRDSAKERVEVKGTGNGNNWSWLYRSIFGHYMGTQKGAKGHYVEVAGRLADLIEPSDGNAELCTRCGYRDYCDLPKCSEQDGYSFKPKGYVDLLVLADKISETARHDMEICGDTVPAWYAAGRLEAVARSIREILGAER